MVVYLRGDLRTIRECNGKSRERLAILINGSCRKNSKQKLISTKTIERAEKGHPIKVEKAEYIAKAFDMTLEDIIDKNMKNN